MSDYVELHCHSAFSLLDGAALPELLIARGAELGYPALALTDHNELGGAVRFAQAGGELGVQAIVGAEITFSAAAAAENSAAGASGRRLAENTVHHLVLLAENRTGYGNLSTLITLGRMNNT